MREDKHTLFGNELHLYKRPNSKKWQCSTYLAGRHWRKSTGEESLSLAKEVAEDWYLDLRGKARSGELKAGKTFKQAAKVFLEEYPIMTAGERSIKYIKSKEEKLKLYLIPFFGDTVLDDITSDMVLKYRIARAQSVTRFHKPPGKSTIHHEIVVLRQVLKTAVRRGWMKAIPDLSSPYKSSHKITHRGWFSREEYKRLYEATRRRAQNPPKPKWKWSCEQLHDYVLFMANTGLRPDEAALLQFRDVSVGWDAESDETILTIEVRGKRGVGYCKSTAGAVTPFRRLSSRPRPVVEGRDGYRQLNHDDQNWAKPKDTDLLFPTRPRDLFNAVLEEEGLKVDREGNNRTAYSLRHSYICFRLEDGADIYQIAKNCRTSVEMIQKYYASHIKSSINAASVNIRKSRAVKKKQIHQEK